MVSLTQIFPMSVFSATQSLLLYISFCHFSSDVLSEWLLAQHIQVATRNTISEMATGFHTKSHSRFLEIMIHDRGKKLRQTDKGSYFFGSTFSNRDNVGPQKQFRRERKSQHRKGTLMQIWKSPYMFVFIQK